MLQRAARPEFQTGAEYTRSRIALTTVAAYVISSVIMTLLGIATIELFRNVRFPGG